MAENQAKATRSWPWFEWTAASAGSLVILFIVAPLLGMVFSSTLGDLSGAAAEAEVRASIRLTLGAAAVAALVSAVFGVPLAWLLARKRFWGRTLVLAIIDLPVIVPHTAAGIALLTLVGRNSVLGGVFGSLVGSFAGIAVAMAFVSVSFLINSARQGFEAVPARLENVARSLGATPFRVFMTVSLPLAWRDILSGCILMWARGISEFGAVVIIAYYPMTTPTLVFERFNDFGLAYARSVAVLLVLICVAIFIVLRFLSRRSNEGGVRHAGAA
jgi:molybdate/tungstate transport system permease protein